MRRTWVGMRLLGFALLVVAGCSTTESHNIKPPLREEYNLPPDETRFSAPVEYPKETLNTPIKRDNGVPGTAFKNSRTGFGAGGGRGY